MKELLKQLEDLKREEVEATNVKKKKWELVYDLELLY